MPDMNTDVLIDLNIPGADDEAIARGVAAAHDVFSHADAWPWDAAAAAVDRERIDRTHAPGAAHLSEEADRLAGVWEDAMAAAFRAAWPDYPDMPTDSDFRLLGQPVFHRARG
jgi:hypothetical protein